MQDGRHWSRVRRARLFRVLIVYLGASWAILQIAAFLREEFQLPPWVTPFALLLLLIGLVIVMATAWVQSARAPEVPGASESESVTDVAGAPSPWAVDLTGVKDSLLEGRLPHPTWGRAVVGGVVAFSLLFGAAGVYVLVSERGAAVVTPRTAEAAVAPGIAVLPFRVVGPDLELWREGMMDLLSTNLDGVAGLRTIDPRTVLSRWRAEIGTEVEAGDPQVALAVARSAGGAYAITGSAVSLGGGVRLTAEVYDLETGSLQGRSQVEGSRDSVLALVDRLSVDLLRSGLIRGDEAALAFDLRGATTESPAALKAYLEGEQKYRRGLWDEATADFSRALELDSTFALAHYRLTVSVGWSTGFSERALELSRRAARFSDRVPERMALLLTAQKQFEELHPDAIATLEELTRRYPDYVESWYELGEALFHIGPRVLRPIESSEAAFRKAIELDPSFTDAFIHLIDLAIVAGDSARARELIGQFEDWAPNSPVLRGFQLLYARTWGDSLAREQALAALDTANARGLHYVLTVPLTHSSELWEQGLEFAQAMTRPERAVDDRGVGHFRAGLVYQIRGRLEEARAAWREGAKLESDFQPHRFEANVDLFHYAWGYAEIEDARRAAEVLAADPSPVDRFYLAVLAADEGRWSDASRILDMLEASAASPAAGTDSLRPASLAQALRSYVAVRRGDLEAALHEFEQPMPRIRDVDHELLRYALGAALLDADRPREAERFFRSLGSSPALVPAEFYLGQVHERLGNSEQARLHYARFVSGWTDCDPVLRPRWERGRQALERLTGERRS